MSLLGIGSVLLSALVGWLLASFAMWVARIDAHRDGKWAVYALLAEIDTKKLDVSDYKLMSELVGRHYDFSRKARKERRAESNTKPDQLIATLNKDTDAIKASNTSTSPESTR